MRNAHIFREFHFMKVRKITAFIVAILSVLSIATYIPQANTVSAASNVEFVYSFNSYSVSFVTGKFTSETATGYKYKATEKLEGTSEEWSLKTVWGVGYKFETK